MDEITQIKPPVQGLVLMTLVQRSGAALQYAAEEMKGDRELCMVAVADHESARLYGSALQHASEKMKGDRELCTAAVVQDVFALQYAS